jgi:amidase
MSLFILELDEGRGLRVAVKDLIDIRGTPTTAGSPAVAARALPASADAACLEGVRAAGVRLVGKTNLHELAAGATGVNRWYGTPDNPVDPRLVPGGSSSGSAVAVATDAADVALGTDTGGSVRIPSACCGTVGLETTWGRVPTDGVWPLAPSLDTVGPMARDVAGVVAGMRLLEPGFAPAPGPAAGVGRVRLPGTHPLVDAAVDAALAACELPVTEVRLPGWAAAGDATLVVILAEAWESDRCLLSDPLRLDAGVRELITLGGVLPSAELTAARLELDGWKRELGRAVGRAGGVLALPTLLSPPPTLEEAVRDDGRLVLATAPVNGAGFPALALPQAAVG